MEPKSEIKPELKKRLPLWSGTDLSAVVLQKTRSLLIASSLVLTSCTVKSNLADQQTTSETFKINLPREIHSVDPLLLRGTAKRYVLFNVHRGLFYYDKENKLKSYGAQNCAWSSPLHFDCMLTSAKWNDGTLITAQDYVRTYEQIIKLNDESMESLKNIVNISSLGDRLIRFELDKHIKDIEHRLTSLALTPRNDSKLFNTTADQLFSGPYAVKNLNKKRINLISNTHFDKQLRPPVQGIFIDDPTAALNMFENGDLDFLRYLESSNIRAYPDVLFAPFAKLDGLFLNQKKLSLAARKALTLSLDFKALQKLYESPSTPGCLALPQSFFEKKINCLTFNLKEAKTFLRQSELKNLSLKIQIPSADVIEHKKLALWAREQWFKNLGLSVEIELIEAKMFYSQVKDSKYLVYRKAHPLDNLSCSDAVASLQKESEFAPLITGDAIGCRAFFKKALESYFWIPLGLPYYTHLPSKNFSGYYINLLGQFGLENLKKKE